MSRCLSDHTLWGLWEGEGTTAQRVHLERCADCRARYQWLGRDLRVLRRVLQEAPPPHVVPLRAHARGMHWLPVAAALAAVLLVVGIQWGLRWPTAPDLSMADQGEAVSYLQAALDGEWPCDGREPFFHLGCDEEALALLAESP